MGGLAATSRRAAHRGSCSATSAPRHVRAARGRATAGSRCPASGSSASARRAIPSSRAFRDGLRELGYAEGKGIAVEYRYAEGVLDRVRDLAAELVGLGVDVLVVGGTIAAQAAQDATATVPIVLA